MLLGCALAIAVCLSSAPGAAQDDWRVVPHSNSAEGSASGESPASRPNSSSDAPDRSREFVIACGERARPAGEPLKSMMAQIASVWGAQADVQLFESSSRRPAYARGPGCVFYSPTGMAWTTAALMHIEDDKAKQSVFYAILAHELGHVMHHDFERGRQQLGSVRCELEADQFAGYTLSRLNIRAENISDYYRLTGDDSFGFQVSHGTGEQRGAAFLAGWRRGEMGLTEQSTIGVGGTGHP